MVHVLLRVFDLSLSPVVCRMVDVLIRVSDLPLPPVVCRMVHVLLRVFDLSLPTRHEPSYKQLGVEKSRTP
jgi:hypothetical protein